VKKLYYSFTILLLIKQTTACPTCVAKVDETTPPFFTEEFYSEQKSDTVSEKTEPPSSLKGKNEL
jgi:hypothetical protein